MRPLSSPEIAPKRSQPLPSLYLITDRHQTGLGLSYTVEQALNAGVKLLQLREKDLPLAQQKEWGWQLNLLCRRHGASLLINSQIELAAELEASGVQLGAGTSSVKVARRRLGSHALIGYSAHNFAEIVQAYEQGADFVTFSPVYFTPSKRQYGPPQGLEALRAVCRTPPLPVYALGGISTEKIVEVIKAGAYGIAAISAVFSAADPFKATQKLLKEIATASKS
ncbi:MAG: thiamine phosphate synthase [Deltaproteobacteria bacterium]|nr:thiamine phosphate synthase [Deltaproteobacteria bacterium]NCP03103.1 thiamine phosphate synthase [Deltaproteobacteria bacterium]